MYETSTSSHWYAFKCFNAYREAVIISSLRSDQQDERNYFPQHLLEVWFQKSKLKHLAWTLTLVEALLSTDTIML